MTCLGCAYNNSLQCFECKGTGSKFKCGCIHIFKDGKYYPSCSNTYIESVTSEHCPICGKIIYIGINGNLKRWDE